MSPVKHINKHYSGHRTLRLQPRLVPLHVVNRAFELFSIPGALSRVMHQSIHPHTLNQQAPG